MKYLSLPLLALAALFLFAGPVAAAEAPPRISLGPLADTYERLRPLATVLFVAVGLGAAMLRVWHALTGMAQSARDGGVSSGPSASALVGSIVSIVILVALAVFLLWNWVDVVNAVIDIFWSLTSDVGSVADPSSAPSASPTP